MARRGRCRSWFSLGLGWTVEPYDAIPCHFVVGSAGSTNKSLTPNRLVDSRKNIGIRGKIKA